MSSKLSAEEEALLKGEKASATQQPDMTAVDQGSTETKKSRKRKDAAEESNPVTDPIVEAVEADAGKTTAPTQTVGEELEERTVSAKAAAKEQAEVDKLFEGQESEEDVPRANQPPVQYDGDGWGDTPLQMRGK